jgi:hydroxymethylglutaryl-CoA lyase
MSRPSEIRIVEVGPRDGLQNEAVAASVAERIALIEALAAAGLRTIEVGSFVSPERVPQMARTDEVLKALDLAGVRLPVLVPNRHGLAAAMAAGASEIAIFASASESFSRRNLNRGIAESLAAYREVAEEARRAGLAVRGYVSCVLGCPYEGTVAVRSVVEVASALAEMGAFEISLGDTIGVGTPDRASAMVQAVAGSVGRERIALHFHDTYGQALANVLACLEVGVSVVDSAVAGLGGCPFAPGASGNLATEDLVYMLDGLGVATGVDIAAVAQAGQAIASAIGTVSRSRAGAALIGTRRGEEGRCSTQA